MKEAHMQAEVTHGRSSWIGALLTLQALVLVVGNYVGWSTIFREVNDYCDQLGRGYGALLDFSGGVVTNPLLTPCFWGSIVFVVALAWTVRILLLRDTTRQHGSLARLWWLLLGGTLFALLNNLPVVYQFYTKPAGGIVSCSAGVVTNPFITSCFLGFAAFLLAFLTATVAKKLIASRGMS